MVPSHVDSISWREDEKGSKKDKQILEKPQKSQVHKGFGGEGKLEHIDFAEAIEKWSP